MAFTSLRLEIAGGIARLSFCQPERGNPIDATFCAEMAEAAVQISENPAVRCVLISAEGKAFSYGGDIGSFVSARLGHKYAENIIGVHLHLAGPAMPPYPTAEDFAPEEQAWGAKFAEFMAQGHFASHIRRMRLLRLAVIVRVVLKYGLDEFLTGHERFRAVRPIAHAVQKLVKKTILGSVHPIGARVSRRSGRRRGPCG